MTRLVIMCSDPRMNAYADEKYNDGNTIFIRNAGAMVLSSKETILELVEGAEVDSIHIVAHKDCKAMGEAFDCFSNGKKYIPEIQEMLAPYRERNLECNFANRAELEADNPKFQAELLTNMLKDKGKNVPVTLELFDATTVTAPSEEHKLVITLPGSMRYSEASSLAGSKAAYVIQANLDTRKGIREIIGDVRLLESLHKMPIVFVAQNKSEERTLGYYQDQLKNSLSDVRGMRDVSISLVCRAPVSAPRTKVHA